MGDAYSFYNDWLIPLNQYGFGSIENLLQLKFTDLIYLKNCMGNEDTIKLIKYMHGINEPTK